MQRYKVLITINSDNDKKSFTQIINYDEEKQYLYYVENDPEKTVNIYDYKKNTLKRDNSKIYLELNFINKKITNNKLQLKDLNNYLDIDIFTESIEVIDKNITIKYLLNNEKYLYKLEIMEEVKWVY